MPQRLCASSAYSCQLVPARAPGVVCEFRIQLFVTTTRLPAQTQIAKNFNQTSNRKIAHNFGGCQAVGPSPCTGPPLGCRPAAPLHPGTGVRSGAGTLVHEPIGRTKEDEEPPAGGGEHLILARQALAQMPHKAQHLPREARIASEVQVGEGEHRVAHRR